VSPPRLFLSYGTGTSCLLSSLLMAFGKETLSLPIYLSSVWKSSPLPSTMMFTKVPGTPSVSLQTAPKFLTFSLHMMSFSSPRQNVINSDSLLLCFRFSQASGLKINLSKSRDFYSTSTPQAKINRLTSISGIRSTTSLDKYLGFPILKGRPKRSDFHFIIEKMQSRLVSWKHRLLNKPGRVTLASSVLSSIHSYYMQVIWRLEYL
jgi:hypothetical protein